MIHDNGVRPVCASGSRWIAHKFQAMKRVLSKYGAYTNHIAALSTDRSVTSTDRANLKGYYNKWTHAKYLFGCALFADLLNPCAVLSKSLQKDDVDILGALTGIIKTLKKTEKLASKPLEEWPTYAATLNKCSPDGNDGAISYQCQSLKGFKETLRMYSAKYTEYCSKVTECIKSRLSWSDLEMMRDIIFVLSSHVESIERLVERFIIPLQGAGVLTGVIKEEFQNMIEYAVEYIAVSSHDYKSTWWRLFHAPNASEWQNALTLATLLFSLPASNGNLERVFSTLHLIKDKKRSRLTNEALDGLVLQKSSAVSLEDLTQTQVLIFGGQLKTEDRIKGKESNIRLVNLNILQIVLVLRKKIKKTKVTMKSKKNLLENWDQIFDSIEEDNSDIDELIIFDCFISKIII